MSVVCKCQTPVANSCWRGPAHKRIGKAEEANFRQNCFFLHGSARVFRPPKHTYVERNLLGFMELLVLLRFGTFSFDAFEERESDFWSDVWPVIDDVVWVSILFEGGGFE